MFGPEDYEVEYYALAEPWIPVANKNGGGCGADQGDGCIQSGAVVLLWPTRGAFLMLDTEGVKVPDDVLSEQVEGRGHELAEGGSGWLVERGGTIARIGAKWEGERLQPRVLEGALIGLESECSQQAQKLEMQPKRAA